MKKKIISSSLIAIGFLLGASALSTLAAWTAPVSTPPNCTSGQPGCDAPLNVGPSSQSKTGPLVVNTSSVLDDIGLTITGKIKLDDIRKGAGKVLVSDADGVGTWDNIQGYQMRCLPWVAGAANDRCCRVNIATGAVECRENLNFSGAWSTNSNPPFTATTPGSYSIEMVDAVSGYRAVILCRLNNKTGSSECKTSGAGYGWSTAGPWGPVGSNPF